MMRLETPVRLLLIGALSTAAMIGCAPTPEDAAAPEAAVTEPRIDLAAEEEAVLQVNRVWLERTHARDAAGIGELFVEEGWRLTAEEGVIEGPAAIAAALEEDMTENPEQLEDWGSKGVWVAASGDLAVERGWWTSDRDGEGEAEPIEGEYVTVLVKRDGAWKILTDASAPIGGISADG